MPDRHSLCTPDAALAKHKDRSARVQVRKIAFSYIARESRWRGDCGGAGTKENARVRRYGAGVIGAAEGGRQGRERDEGRGRLFSNAEILIRLLCKNPLFRTLGKILFSDCAKCRILLRANSGEEKLRRFFSFLVEKSGAGVRKGACGAGKDYPRRILPFPLPKSRG